MLARYFLINQSSPKKGGFDFFITKIDRKIEDCSGIGWAAAGSEADFQNG
jgi:hypothetical protein